MSENETETDDQPVTFDVSGEGLYQHEIGDEACCEGWCAGRSGAYPKPCACGGLIHADFGDENEDGYWLYTKCDKCGERE